MKHASNVPPSSISEQSVTLTPTHGNDSTALCWTLHTRPCQACTDQWQKTMPSIRTAQQAVTTHCSALTYSWLQQCRGSTKKCGSPRHWRRRAVSGRCPDWPRLYCWRCTRGCWRWPCACGRPTRKCPRRAAQPHVTPLIHGSIRGTAMKPRHGARPGSARLDCSWYSKWPQCRLQTGEEQVRQRGLRGHCCSGGGLTSGANGRERAYGLIWGHMDICPYVHRSYLLLIRSSKTLFLDAMALREPDDLGGDAPGPRCPGSSTCFLRLRDRDG